MKTIALSRPGKVAFVDDEDYDRLIGYSWSLHSHGYAFRNIRTSDGRRGVVLMHRQVMKAASDQKVDHRDLDKLNNQKYNLRWCTGTQNNANARRRSHNSAKYKGVTSKRNKWRARITCNGQEKALGVFDTQEEAARAYDAAARQLFGEFARTNF